MRDIQPVIDVAKESVQLPLVQQVEDRFYATETLMLVEAPLPPVTPAIEVASLQAVVDYVEGNPNKEDFLLVDTNSVQVIGPPAERSQVRPVRLLARSNGTWKPGNLDRWLSQVDFLLWAQQSFAPVGDLVEVLTIASNIKTEKVAEANANSFEQTVIVRKGGGQTLEKLKPVYSLYPYRSFPEITPLLMTFAFRKQDSEDANKPPTLGLFNADSGQWSVAMRAAIKVWLREQLPNITILA